MMGPDEIPVVVWKILYNLSIEWLTNFFNHLLVESTTSKVWRKSCVVPKFNGKEDIQ